MLGAHLTFQGPPDVESLSVLVADCKAMARRVAALDMGFERHALILQGGVVPRTLHGCSVNALGARQLATL